MKSIIRNLAVFTLLALVVVVPFQASALDLTNGLVPCGQDGPLLENGRQACGFPQLIQLLINIMDFLLFIVAPIIMVLTILYAGFLMLFSGGSTENISKAKGLFLKAVIGMAIAMSAWIFIKFILVTLKVDTKVFPAFWS